MQTAIIAFELSLFVLMLVSMVSMMRLRQKIKAFQSMQTGLQSDLSSFSEATDKAQVVFANLQKAMNEYQNILGKDRKGADELRQDLLYLVEQGKMIADKLENALHDLRPKTTAKDMADKNIQMAPSDTKSKDALLKSIENLR